MRSTGTARLVSASLAVSIALAFVISLFGSALKNTVQVFFLPMAESFGESRGSFALATTTFAITFAVAAPITGAISDRLGPARVLTLGTVAAGLAFVLCAISPAFPIFVAVYGVLASFAYAMLSYVPLGVLVDRVFSEDRKGFFYALLTNSVAAGFILLVPLWTWLSDFSSWNSIYLVLGLTLLIVITPLAAVKLRDEAPAVVPSATPRAKVRVQSAFSSSVFWKLAGAFFACGATMAFIDVHMMPFMDDMHVPADLSTTSIVLLGVFEIGGSLVAGRLCDRGMIKSVLIAGYLLRAGSLFIVTISPHGSVVIAFGVIFGVSYLFTVVATSMWVLKSFPIEIKGAVMGLIWTGHQIGAALSSQLGAFSYDATGSYVPEILGIGAVAVLAAVLVATIPSPQSKPVANLA